MEYDTVGSALKRNQGEGLENEGDSLEKSLLSRGAWPTQKPGGRDPGEEMAGAKVPWQESACLIGGTASQHNFYLHF